MRVISASAALLLALSVPGLSTARADDGAYVLTIKDHRFEPAELTVPVDKRVQLTIDNQDATPEEFESHDLRVEKADRRPYQGYDMGWAAAGRRVQVRRRVPRGYRPGQVDRKVRSPCSVLR